MSQSGLVEDLECKSTDGVIKMEISAAALDYD